MRILRSKLTYANVIATLALFLALSGGVVWAASKIGAKQLKANSVTTAKIKKNAVTAAKIKAKAISNAKLADGSVNFAKLATGTSVIGTAISAPIVANTEPAPVPVPLTGTTTFTPAAGSVYFLSVEAIGKVARTGAERCDVEVVPLVNGNKWEVAEGFLSVRAIPTSAEELTGSRPVSGETGILGLASPGVPQTISAEVFGDKDCTSTSTVSVALAITQLK
jgi:hypothetical protein